MLMLNAHNSSPSNTEILYGYKPETTTFYVLNHYLLIAKYHVFLARNRSETPNLKVFLALLDSKIKCERQIAVKNSNYKNIELSGPLSATSMRESFIISCMWRGACVCKCVCV